MDRLTIGDVIDVILAFLWIGLFLYAAFSLLFGILPSECVR